MVDQQQQYRNGCNADGKPDRQQDSQPLHTSLGYGPNLRQTGGGLLARRRTDTLTCRSVGDTNPMVNACQIAS